MKKSSNSPDRPPLLRSFVSYYRPHRRTFVLDMLCAFVYAAAGLAYPILSRTILNTYIPQGRIGIIVGLCMGLVGIYILRALMDYYVCYYGHRMGVYIQADMRHDLFAHLQTLPYGYFDDVETGQLMSRMTNDLFNVSELAHHGPENLFITSFVLIGSFVYLCTINWKLALIIFAFLPVMLLVTARCRKEQRLAFAKSKQEIGNLNATLENSLAGVRVTKAYNNARLETDRFDNSNKGFVIARGWAYKAMGKFHSAMGFFSCLYNAVVLLAGALFCVYDGEHFDYADLTAFMLSINLLISPIQTLINFVEQLQDGASGYRRFYEIMQVPSEQDAPDAVELTDVKGDVRFDHVSFGYQADRGVLNDISLHITPGQTYAFVGSSGGGKTTLCHLLPRFYHADAGQILIDGVPIERITAKSLRDNIGIVQQNVFLFTGSFYDNIAYGCPNATAEQVEQAAKRANIYDFIMQQPQGFDTPVGEHGVRLSGGQQQRLSIARVFLKDPAILVLDEATSALDNVTEAAIQQSLNELCQGRTTLIVAHRLSTVRHADHIVVLADGVIREQGTHEQLMANQGDYYKLQTTVCD